MTALLPDKALGANVGKRVRDCETGEVFTILYVDSDGDYVLYFDPDGAAIYCRPDDIHAGDAAHFCRCKEWGYFEDCPDCRAGLCWDCYTWIKETT